MKDQFVFYEFRLHQVSDVRETENSVRLSVTTGFTSTNVSSEDVLPLTLDTLQMSSTFQHLDARLRDIRNLNFPRIHPILVDLWQQACRATTPADADAIIMKAEGFVSSILSRVENFTYEGISLLRP